MRSNYKRYAVRKRTNRRTVRRNARSIVPLYRPKLRPNITYLKRTCFVFSWAPNTSTIDGFWRYFGTNLASMTNATEITLLFDQYKIAALKYTFRPRNTGFDGANTTDTTLPGVTNLGTTHVHIINDPYSTVTPSGTYTAANLNSFLEQGHVKSYTGIRPFSVYIKPTTPNVLDQTNNSVRKRAGWINTTTAGINHYGFHVFMQDTNLAGVFGQTFDVFCTYYLMARNPK